MSGETKKLKCKFCNVRVNRWKKTKDGETVDGFDTLKEHIIIYHPEQADKMEMQF